MRTERFWQSDVTPRRWGSVLVVVLAVAALGASWALAASVTRVSRDTAGTQGNDGSGGNDGSSALSADGRVVAFTSAATNLVPGDTNGAWDVFVHDRQTKSTTLVSRNSAGIGGDGWSDFPAISADGQVVAFMSTSTNFIPGDTSGTPDIFVHDRQTGRTTLVSRNSAGTRGNSTSWSPVISADGRVVAFHSLATNLVPGDTNGTWDVFVHDRQTATTTMVSRNSAGTQGNADSAVPTLSADGRFVAFRSAATNLVPSDTNGIDDVFIHDRQTGTTTLVSRNSAGLQGNSLSDSPVLSADGRVVAFASWATNLVPGDTLFTSAIFVHDRQTGTTTMVSRNSAGLQGNGLSFKPAISADGRLVAFVSEATNLVPGDTNGGRDVFVHDRQTATTIRVSRNSAGLQGNDDSDSPALSADGRVVAFGSWATNLVPGDTNGTPDVFVYDPFWCYGFAVTIMGTPGDDILVGTDGDDVIDGLDGDDTIAGGGGNDVICGGPGNDRLRGGSGSDRLFGDAGADVLYGDSGPDRLFGGPGNDTLHGGANDDALDGGFGTDVCDGGLHTTADTAASTCETVVNVP